MATIQTPQPTLYFISNNYDLTNHGLRLGHHSILDVTIKEKTYNHLHLS